MPVKKGKSVQFVENYERETRLLNLRVPDECRDYELFDNFFITAYGRQKNWELRLREK